MSVTTVCLLQQCQLQQSVTGFKSISGCHGHSSNKCIILCNFLPINHKSWVCPISLCVCGQHFRLPVHSPGSYLFRHSSHRSHILGHSLRCRQLNTHYIIHSCMPWSMGETRCLQRYTHRLCARGRYYHSSRLSAVCVLSGVSIGLHVSDFYGHDSWKSFPSRYEFFISKESWLFCSSLLLSRLLQWSQWSVCL